MTAFEAGPLRVHAAGGSDRRGGGDGPAIVLCHGFGAPGDDLVSLARVIDAGPGVRWFFPEAPLELRLGFGVAGRAWWEIDMARLEQLMRRADVQQLIQDTPAGLAEARAALEACIDALVRDHGVARDRMILGGFSQGAMVSTEVALHAAQPFAGVVLLSGALISAPRWTLAARVTGPSLRVLMTHGRADPLLPFEGAEMLRALLEGAGASVAWAPHNGQHEIPELACDRFAAFARARLG